jgi:hypothetical protein
VRLLHLAPSSKERAIRRSGLAGGRVRIADETGAVVALPRAVFAMPVVPGFWTSHQWLRELRRWHDERMVAVHFRLPDQEPVHVGRFGAAHRLLPAAAAARWVMDHPEGAQVVVTRSIPRRDVTALRAVPQLVGWTGKPETDASRRCVCIVCLPGGSRDLMRRVRAAFQAGVDQARRAGDEKELLAALADLEVPLERARGRLAIAPVLAFAAAESADVRAAVAGLLGLYRRREAEPPLLALAADDDEEVCAAAVWSLLHCSGARRAGELLRGAAVDVIATFDELVELAADGPRRKRRRR